MRAYILCGGFGTRLSTVLKGGQKAVVDVHGRPFLALVLEQLRLAGVSEAVLCAHYRADQMAELLPQLSAESGVALQLVVEEQPLGTGGAILNALREVAPGGRYVVLNADTWLQASAYRLAFDCAQDAIVAVLVEDRSRYGSLECSTGQELLALHEKGLDGPGRVNAGVYAFAAGSLQGFEVQACSMEKDILPRLIERRQLHVCDYRGPFVDIGTPDSLTQFKSGLQGADQ